MNGSGNVARTVWLFHCHSSSRLANGRAYQNSSFPWPSWKITASAREYDPGTRSVPFTHGAVVVSVANGRTGTIVGRPGGAGPSVNPKERTPVQQPSVPASQGDIQFGIACHQT